MDDRDRMTAEDVASFGGSSAVLAALVAIADAAERYVYQNESHPDDGDLVASVEACGPVRPTQVPQMFALVDRARFERLLALARAANTWATSGIPDDAMLRRAWFEVSLDDLDPLP